MNSKLPWLLVYLLLCVFVSTAQVGINTTAPEGALHINSSTMGVIPPKVVLTSAIVQAPVTNPQGGNLTDGTMVYNTASDGTPPNAVNPGYYYWRNSRWNILFDTSTIRSAKYEDTNSSDNINLSAGTLVDIIDDEIFNDDTGLFVQPSGDDDELEVTEAGRYEIIANIFIRDVSAAKNTIVFRLQVENSSGTITNPGSASVVYFSGDSDDEYSSAFVNEVVDLSAGDIVSVFGQNIGGSPNSSTVRLNNSISMRSNFFIRRVEQ